MPGTKMLTNPPLNGIQRTDSFREKYINLLRTAQEVHMFVNHSYDTSAEDFEESVEVLKVKLTDWYEPTIPGTCQAMLQVKFGNAVKQIIQAALDEVRLYLGEEVEPVSSPTLQAAIGRMKLMKAGGYLLDVYLPRKNGEIYTGYAYDVALKLHQEDKAVLADAFLESLSEPVT